MGILTTIDAGTLAAPGDEAIADSLESNHIVYFPRCPIPLPDSATLEFLRTGLSARLKLKNVSYHPEADRVTGIEADAATSERITAILREHLAGVSGFLQTHMPHLADGWTVGTCSFRPIQERGRNLDPHASSELIHVDAGTYGATDGDRILRFFVNVNPEEDRVWATKGPIEDVLDRFGRDAGLIDSRGKLTVRLNKAASDRAFSRIVGGLAHVYPLARVLDSSPYDRAMRRLHNFMKDTATFRDDQRGYEEVRFPPYSAWMVFADSVSHGCVSGQYAFITTFILRRRNMRRPEYSPFNVLELHTGDASGGAPTAPRL